LFYAAIFHALGGAVAGSLFTVRILLFLSGILLVEALAAAFVNIEIAEPWALINIVALQVGYLAGVFIRGGLEHAGVLVPPAEIHRGPLP
jgi:hypothetical protein